MRRLYVEGCNKPARPPALQVRPSRVQANRIIITSTIGGPAASPAAGTTVAGPGESHHYHGHDWRAGGLAGRRYKCNME